MALASAGSPPNQPFVPNTAAHAPVVRNPTSTPPSAPQQNPPPARARHTTDQPPAENPVESPVPTAPTDNNARRVHLDIPEDDSSNDAFDVVLDNTYNNECDYYLSNYITAVNKLTLIILTIF